MSMIFDEPMAAAPPPVSPTTKNYQFVVVCKSGQTKEFACEAADFVEARKLLSAFVKEN